MTDRVWMGSEEAYQVPSTDSLTNTCKEGIRHTLGPPPPETI